MKILVIRISSLGDVILSTYLVRLLRKMFPTAIIDFLVAKEFSIVFKFNPHLDNLIEYNKSKSFLSHLLETLSINNPRHYDVIIDLQNNLRSWIYSWGKGTNAYRFDKRRFYKFKLVYLKKRTNLFQPIAILYRDSFPQLRNFDDGLGLELWTRKDGTDYKPHYKQIEGSILRRIAIAPGAKHFTKRLPTNKFVELVNLLQERFGAEIVLLGGNEDVEICKEIARQTKNVENYAGALDVLGTAELLDNVDLVVSNDSAVVHISAARRVPVVQVFGSTVPEFGFIPFRTPFAIVENNSLECRPCTHFGKSHCPKRHFKCMEGISAKMILDAISQLKFTSDRNQ